MLSTVKIRVLADTDSLLFGEAHDLHGLHGLFIHLVVLLAGELNMASTQETVITEGLQEKLLWKYNTQLTLTLCEFDSDDVQQLTCSDCLAGCNITEIMEKRNVC